MRIISLVVVAVLCGSAVASANYVGPATVVGVTLNPGAPPEYRFRFTGNAGEDPVVLSFSPDAATANEARTQVREWISRTLQTLNDRQNRRALYAVNDTVAPLAPTLTQAQIDEAAWFALRERVKRMREDALTNTTAVANLATLEAQLNATYLPAYDANR